MVKRRRESGCAARRQGHMHFEPARQQHNRPLACKKRFALSFFDNTEALGIFDAPHHDGKRFVHPAFVLTQTIHGRVVYCVAGQVKSAESLDGNDGAAFQQARGFPNGFRDVARAPLSSRSSTCGPQSHKRWAARGSGGLQDRRIPPGRPRTF